MPHKVLTGRAFPHSMLSVPLAWLDPRLRGNDEAPGTFWMGHNTRWACGARQQNWPAASRVIPLWTGKRAAFATIRRPIVPGEDNAEHCLLPPAPDPQPMSTAILIVSLISLKNR